MRIWIANIWITNFYLFAIQMSDNCPVFKWHLYGGQNCLVFRCPVMSVIQALIWIVDNFVRHSDHNLINRPFDDWTNVHDLNTRQVRYSDPLCICLGGVVKGTFKAVQKGVLCFLLAGQWPKEGPKPSKLAVLFFYLSVVFTVIGIIIVIRSAFYVEVCANS